MLLLAPHPRAHRARADRERLIWSQNHQWEWSVIIFRQFPA